MITLFVVFSLLLLCAPCEGVADQEFWESTTNEVGGCQEFDQELAPILGNACAPFVAAQIYVTSVQDPYILTAMDAAANASGLWFIQRIYSVMPVGCYKYAMSLYCQTAFPACTDASYANEIYNVSTAPCRSLCEQTNEECGAYFTFIGQPWFNCTQELSYSGLAGWPQGPVYNTTVESADNSTIEMEVSCVTSLYPDTARFPFVFPNVESCPFPFNKKTNPQDADLPCWVPCPTPIYSREQWQQLAYIEVVSSSIAFALMAFLIITYLLDAKKRQFPMNVQIWQFVSAMMVAVGFFIWGVNPQQEVWCVDAATVSSQANIPCAVQGFFFVYFSLCIVAWWVVIAHHMFYVVVLEKTMKRYFQPIYHILAWGVPLFLVGFSMGYEDSIGFGPPGPWCFIKSLDTYAFVDGTGQERDYYIFYIPLGAAVLSTVIMFGVVVLKIIKIRMEVKGKRAHGNSPVFRAQVRIMLFIVVIFLVFTLLFTWRIYLTLVNAPKMEQTDLEWVICKIKTELSLPANSAACEGNELPSRPLYSYTAFETAIATGLGIFVFGVFGTETKIYKPWKKLYYRMMASRKSEKSIECSVLVKPST